MNLNYEQKKLLDGEKGPGFKKAMEILLSYGNCYDASKLIPITSVHTAVCYSVCMEEGIKWLEDFGNDGAKVSVFTTKNSDMYDFDLVDELLVPEIYRLRQNRIDKAIKKLGVTPTYTCHHYMAGNLPKYGDHIAWASSGSQVYANSIIGARSNRDGDHVALAAAIVGSIPEWGLHQTQNRKGEILIDVKKLDLSNYSAADFMALGWYLGKLIATKIPVFINFPKNLRIEYIKSLFYTLTVTGGPGLIHLVGITPEAPSVESAFHGKQPTKVDIEANQKLVDTAYQEISTSSSENLDMVLLGCPHCSMEEMREIADLLEGKKVSHMTALWVCTSKWIKTLCERSGLLDKIQSSGGRILADTCAADGPHAFLKEQGVRVIATNSARASYYGHNLGRVDTWFGSTKECIMSAISGRWEGKK